MNRYPLGALFVLFLASTLPTPAQESGDVSSVSEFDWSRSTLEMTISTVRDPMGRNGAAASLDAQRRLDEHFVRRLLDRLYDVPIDSRMTIGQYIEQDPQITTELFERASEADRGVPYTSPDLSRLLRRYSVRVFPDLAEIFVHHEAPFPMEEVIRWLPTRQYTGVVIYAGEPLPVRGEEAPDGGPLYEEIEPALFPEILDTNFRPVLQQDMLYPDWIRRWGIVAYTESSDETAWIDRVGNRPLRIMAEQVFGIRRSDIVISPGDADRLLASDHNRDILRQGRILVIVPGGVSSD